MIYRISTFMGGAPIHGERNLERAMAIHEAGIRMSCGYFGEYEVGDEVEFRDGRKARVIDCWDVHRQDFFIQQAVEIKYRDNKSTQRWLGFLLNKEIVNPKERGEKSLRKQRRDEYEFKGSIGYTSRRKKDGVSKGASGDQESKGTPNRVREKWYRPSRG
jgi:hypothetical protein